VNVEPSHEFPCEHPACPPTPVLTLRTESSERYCVDHFPFADDAERVSAPSETQRETWVRIAAAEHHRVGTQLVMALELRIIEVTLAWWPTATELHVEGEYGEDGDVRLRAQKVTGPLGLIAGYVDNQSSEDRWDEFVDDGIDSIYLDWLAAITYEDYLGDHVIELHVSPPCTPFTIADRRRPGPATNLWTSPLDVPPGPA
jgi:hypothetical protein